MHVEYIYIYIYIYMYYLDYLCQQCHYNKTDLAYKHWTEHSHLRCCRIHLDSNSSLSLCYIVWGIWMHTYIHTYICIYIYINLKLTLPRQDTSTRASHPDKSTECKEPKAPTKLNTMHPSKHMLRKSGCGLSMYWSWWQLLAFICCYVCIYAYIYIF
jgi:hypothetical protein